MRIPLRRRAHQFPEIYRGAGKWDPYKRLAHFLNNAQEVTAERFDAAVQAFDAAMGGPP